jgi:hypothetical protein
MPGESITAVAAAAAAAAASTAVATSTADNAPQVVFRHGWKYHHLERSSVDRATKENTVVYYPFFANDNYQDYIITKELLVDMPYRAAEN